MAELRREPILGQWVIVATAEDSLTPDSYEKERHEYHQEAICPFCPGREKQTPPEVDAIRDPATGAWSARVVPNKFPALKIEGQLDKRGIGIYDVSNGIGAHEVLIETPEHRKNLADLSVEEVGHVIQLFQNRSLNLAQDQRFKYIMVFKNYGESAGASLEHAHSQIIALPMVPKVVLAELEGAKSYYKFRGRCLYCDIIEQERQDNDRIVTENEDFIAFCPFVSRYPFETWILPRDHPSDFCRLIPESRMRLAEVLKEMLTRLKASLSDPSYNFYVHVPPVKYDNLESFHWHIEIAPQLTREAGYEWGTGLSVSRTSPNLAAEYLRKALVSV